MFDGVHAGHQSVLSRSQEKAHENNGIAVAFTFPEHPASFLRPESAPSLLMNKDEKAKYLIRTGMDGVVLRTFDQEFANVEGLHFPSFLIARIPTLEGLCVGENFRFGKGRTGDCNYLKMCGEEVGLAVEVVKSELHSSSPVSSSRIREALLVGEIEEVNKMLGREYTVSASVQTGKGMGREFGFPTINLPWSPEAKPAYGVYVGQLRRDGEEDKYAIANYGLRPTVEEGSTEPLLEVHVLDSIHEDFASSGVSLSMTLEAFLRPEKKFDSVDDLRIQIKKDILRAKELRGQN
jgi:riboflavin kinase/FMN adenylyltransferase